MKQPTNAYTLYPGGRTTAHVYLHAPYRLMKAQRYLGNNVELYTPD
jgi:hypothetical protein